MKPRSSPRPSYISSTGGAKVSFWSRGMSATDFVAGVAGVAGNFGSFMATSVAAPIATAAVVVAVVAVAVGAVVAARGAIAINPDAAAGGAMAGAGLIVAGRCGVAGVTGLIAAGVLTLVGGSSGESKRLAGIGAGAMDCATTLRLKG